MIANLRAVAGRGAIAVGFVIAVGCGGKTPDTTQAPTSDDRNTCSSADDCTLVEACCGCKAGGRRVAIRKDAVGDYEATRSTRCAHTECGNQISSHSSCDAEAICEADHCRVASHLGRE
jgi:hypothetical protein